MMTGVLRVQPRAHKGNDSGRMDGSAGGASVRLPLAVQLLLPFSLGFPFQAKAEAKRGCATLSG
jgi:hypothetical protein